MAALRPWRSYDGDGEGEGGGGQRHPPKWSPRARRGGEGRRRDARWLWPAQGGGGSPRAGRCRHASSTVIKDHQAQRLCCCLKWSQPSPPSSLRRVLRRDVGGIQQVGKASC